METLKCLHPLRPIVAAFEELGKPMLDEIKTLTVKNTNLRQTRDFLLPKLISGQIDVSDLDIKPEVPA